MEKFKLKRKRFPDYAGAALAGANGFSGYNL